jgi:hypothetical protein
VVANSHGTWFYPGSLKLHSGLSGKNDGFQKGKEPESSCINLPVSYIPKRSSTFKWEWDLIFKDLIFTPDYPVCLLRFETCTIRARKKY